VRVIGEGVRENIRLNSREMNMGNEKDVEKSYSNKEIVAKLRRLADDLEAGTTFEIQIAGQRIYVPPYATIEFEYERRGEEEEVEIELSWKRQ
jgi:amphi-Trp domain-containing protein